ncbi:hypothetical protein QVD17_33213 [Tagetes erecta]|uniref:Ferredoxin thioredoxin reductase alpha chain domain-containing protein n=1 Tax=Tagetes erecta TaxID=13708 RepID=A0AAD8NL02_TARER|nr:hypothetical protein QVD17_33213 [Tagetes erecta]
MTFPATLAAATPINLSSSTVKIHITSPLLHTSSYAKATFNRRTNLISSVKAIVDNPTRESTSEEEETPAKIGARVRVTVPLKVYHIPKVPELDLNGSEGKIKEYIAVWKGKSISANLPYKIEFFQKLEGRGDAPVKFFAHLKEDEFEYLD